VLCWGSGPLILFAFSDSHFLKAPRFNHPFLLNNWKSIERPLLSFPMETTGLGQSLQWSTSWMESSLFLLELWGILPISFPINFYRSKWRRNGAFVSSATQDSWWRLLPIIRIHHHRSITLWFWWFTDPGLSCRSFDNRFRSWTIKLKGFYAHFHIFQVLSKTWSFGFLPIGKPPPGFAPSAQIRFPGQHYHEWYALGTSSDFLGYPTDSYRFRSDSRST
jgi:hypothetical protein